MARKKRVKVTGTNAGRSRSWSLHEELALVRAWTDVVRRQSAALSADMEADYELFVEFQQVLAKSGSSNTEDAPIVPRTKDAVRAKVNRIVSSFKCIQEHLQQQAGGSRRAAGRAREDWFALSTEQQLNILVKVRPGSAKSSVCTIGKDVFELLEQVLQYEKPLVHASEARKPLAKWSAIETRPLVQSCREVLEVNPTARPNATSVLNRFSDLSAGNTRRKPTTFMHKLKLILKTYIAFLDSEYNAAMNEPHSHTSDLPAHFRKFNEQQGKTRQPVDMDDDTIHAFEEIKRMFDSVSSLEEALFHDDDSNSDDDSGIQRYKIKKGAHDQIDIVEHESCNSESESDARCWKRPRTSQVSSLQGDLEFAHVAASASQDSVATTVSIDSHDEDSTRFGDTNEEFQTVPFTSLRECGCSTGSASAGRKLNQIGAIANGCAGGTHGQQLSPARADRSGSLRSSLLETPDSCRYQTQYPRFSFEQATFQTSNGHDECMVMLQHLHDKSRRDWDEIIGAMYRVQLEQQRAQANILRALESLGEELREQRR